MTVVPLGGVDDRRRVDDPTLKRAVHRRLVLEHVDEPVPAGSDLRARLSRLLRDEHPLLPAARLDRLVGELVDEVAGLGPLEPLLADPDVTEVMINGPGRSFVERRGALVEVDLDLDAAAIVQLVERVVAPLGLRLDRASPMVDARLGDGSRLHAVIPPLAIDGPCVTIRRFGARRLALEEFGVTAAAGAFLEWAVTAGWNLLVAGATSAGKTTLLNTLAGSIPRDARVVTIEETAELRLMLEHVVRLEARPANAEGAGAVGVRDLVRAALRMRPDRLVVGEVRGGEALDMLQAINTGHDGSLCTIHANGSDDALRRLETLALMAGSGLPLRAVRSQIAASVDAVVFVARRTGGARRVEAIGVVDADTGTDATPMVRRCFDWQGGRLVPVGVAPTRAGRSPEAPALEPAWFR